jgi:hypothetical protein
MMSATSASKRGTGPMSADSGEADAPEAEATEEDTRKNTITSNHYSLVALAPETEDIEADPDLTEETILAMKGASNVVRQVILREIVLK